MKSGHLSIDDNDVDDNDVEDSEHESNTQNLPVLPIPQSTPPLLTEHSPINQSTPSTARPTLKSGHLSVDDNSEASSSSSSAVSQSLPPPLSEPVTVEFSALNEATRPTVKSGHLSVDDGDSSISGGSLPSVDSNISLSSASDSDSSSDVVTPKKASLSPVAMPATVTVTSVTTTTTMAANAGQALELTAAYLPLSSLCALSRVNKSFNRVAAMTLPVLVRNNGIIPTLRARYWRKCTAQTKEPNYWELVRESTSKYKKMQKAGTSPKQLGWVSVIEMDVQRTYAAAAPGGVVEQNGEEGMEDEGEEAWGSFVSHQSFDEHEKSIGGAAKEGTANEREEEDEWGDFEGHDTNTNVGVNDVVDQTEEEKHKMWEKDTSIQENEEAVTSLLDVLQVNLSIAENHKISKQRLRRILWAFSTHNPEVGYVQGMNMITRLLLDVTEGDEESCFHILCGMVDIDKFRMADMWKEGFEQLQRCMDKLETALQAELPELCFHLDKFGIKPAFYSTKWFLTLYSCYGVVGLDTLHMVWDIFLTEGWGVIFGVAIGVLEVLEAQILGEAEVDGVMEILQNVGAEMMWADDGHGDALDATIRRWANKNVWEVDKKAEEEKGEVLVKTGKDDEDDEDDEDEEEGSELSWDWRSGDC